MVGGQRARPGPVAPYSAEHEMHAGKLVAGQQVRAALLPEVPLVRLRAGGETLHWCTRSALRAAEPEGLAYAPGQVWERRNADRVEVATVNPDGSMITKGGVPYTKHGVWRDGAIPGRNLSCLIRQAESLVAQF